MKRHRKLRLSISVPTVKRWISALEATYIVYLLPPLYNNYGKRIIKAPKLYFYDMGLLNYLLKMPNAELALNSPMAGALFENAVVSEILKRKLVSGRDTAGTLLLAVPERGGNRSDNQGKRQVQDS